MRSMLHQCNIDGTSYEISQFGSSQSLKILIRIAKTIGEPLGKLFANVDPDGGSVMDQKVSDKIIGQVIGGLTEKLDEDQTVDTIKELCSCVLVNGQKLGPMFETHFRGKIGHLFKLLKKVLEVQYDDFLGELLGIVAQSRAGMTMEKPTSTGGSGVQSLQA